MTEWIAFAEGEYWVETALLVGERGLAVALVSPFIEIYKDKMGRKHLKGSGQVENLKVVDLMEETDHPDLVLDLGSGLRFRLPRPTIKAGKVFSPGVLSSVHFYPDAPWVEIPETEYQALMDTIRLL